MKKFLILLLGLMLINSRAKGQPNCNVFLYKGDSLCHKACEIATKASLTQGSKASQEQFDEAIKLCPKLDYAYFEKSVPYLKRGDLKNWKILIDQAVALNPLGHLGYRAWTRYQFARDYKGALEDFKRLHSLMGDEIGYSQNGDYNLNIVEALCHYKLNNTEEAIKLIEKQLAKKNYSPGAFDYLHLGILKISISSIEGGLVALEKEILINDYLADTYYYKGIAFKKLNQREKARQSMEKALEFYGKGYTRKDPYTHPLDKVYLSDIKAALKELIN